MIRKFKLNIQQVLDKNKNTLLHLNDENIPYALFAGAAATFYGVQREIQDLDIVFPASERSLINKSFYNFFFKQKEDSDFALSFKNLELIEGNLKYSIRGSEYHFTYDALMIAKRKTFLWKNNVIYFMSVEDTIVLKIILQREYNGVPYDIEDVIILLQHNKIDTDYLAFRVQKSKIEVEFNRILPILKKRLANFSEILKYE